MVFGQNLKIWTLAKKDTIVKGISRGAEWTKFQLHSTFQWGIMSAERNRIETMDWSMVFGQNLKIWTLVKKDTIVNGISRGAECRRFQIRSTFQ